MKKIVPTLEQVVGLHKSGELAAAKKGYQQLLAASEPTAEIHDLLGLLLAEELDLLNAAQHFQAAHQLDPTKAVYLLHLSNIDKAQGELAQAKAHLEAALQLDPSYAALHNNLGIIAAAEENWAIAVQHYQKAIDLQSNYADAYFNLGLAYRKLANPMLTESAFKALLDLSSAHPGANFQLGMLYMQQERYALAVQHFAKILEAYPHHVESHVNLANCYLKLHQLEQALQHYQAAHAIDASDCQVLFNLGVIAMQYHQLPAAIAYLENLVALDANHFAAHNNLGVLYLHRRDKINAIKHYQYCLRLQPNNAAIQHTLHILKENKTLTGSPPAYIEALFDSYADHYDAHLTQTLHYQVPMQLYELLQQCNCLQKTDLAILDLGCGTGLSAEVFRPLAKKINKFIGVDLSDNMLAIAASKKMYSHLEKKEIIAYLQAAKLQFDLILAADVLVYFGEINLLMQKVAERLEVEGVFAFNTEINSKTDFTLQVSGRFAHAADYIVRAAENVGLKLLKKEMVKLRSQDGMDVAGNLFLFKKEKDVQHAQN